MVVRYDTMNEFCINDDDNIVEQVDHVDDFQPLPVMS